VNNVDTDCSKSACQWLHTEIHEAKIDGTRIEKDAALCSAQVQSYKQQLQIGQEQAAQLRAQQQRQLQDAFQTMDRLRQQQNQLAETRIASAPTGTIASGNPSGESGPSKQQLQYVDAALSVLDTAAEEIGNAIVDIKSSGAWRAFINFLSAEVEPSVSGAITDVGGLSYRLKRA
jgi:hypothetical protein